MSGNNTEITGLISDPGKLKREATKRRRPHESTSIPKHHADEYYSSGWEFERELKTKTRLKRTLSADVRLENRVWLLFYLLGYQELNEKRTFQISINRKDGARSTKQIDVFAKDDETVVIAECKASERVRRRSLQKDLEEFANLKTYLARAVKQHYGANFKPKIIWQFFTSNIIWSDADRERARGERIHVITERELRYYLQIADHLRSAARYQFLAEFLSNQSIPALGNQKVPAIRGKLGGHRFYCFLTTPKHLLKISFVNHRSLNDPTGAPAYQRLVTRTRLRKIGQFLKNGGFFPTNLLLNLTNKPRFEMISQDDSSETAHGYLYLPDKYRSAWVIDGQHRLYGFSQLPESKQNQNVMVLAFEDLSKTEEANLFVEINHEQKTVPKTLLDDLEGELKWNSTVPSERIGAISARLIGILNSDIGEPFFGRVTQQGITATERTCLTVPAIKDGLRRSGVVGKSIFSNREYQPGPLSGTTDSETLDRARSTLNQYFDMIRSANPALWEDGRSGFLCTNVAVQAYLYLLAALIEYMEANKGLTARELDPNELIGEIDEYFDPVSKWLTTATQQDMDSHFKVPFGSGGPPEYFFRVCAIIKESYSDFGPEGMGKWEQEQSIERIEIADKKLKEINIFVQKYIFDTLKTEYGIENDAYWNKGVPDKGIKTKAYEKSLDDDDDSRLPLEHYLDFVQYKKIVENRTHWPLFEPVLDIPEPGEKGYSKNIRWMERINELRRIPAHATEKRLYKVEDFEYIDFIYEELTSRLQKADFDLWQT